MDENEIIDRIRSRYPEAAIDLNGADCSFEIYVVSELFDGKNSLQRQQSLLDLFKDELKTGKLHALSIKARTPAEQVANTGLVQLRR